MAFFEQFVRGAAYRVLEPAEIGVVLSGEFGHTGDGLAVRDDAQRAAPVDVRGEFTRAVTRRSPAIAAPLGIGPIALEDGSTVQGFLCDAIAVRDAREMTSCGGWRVFLAGGSG